MLPLLPFNLRSKVINLQHEENKYPQYNQNSINSMEDIQQEKPSAV